MIEIEQTEAFTDWLNGLSDRKARVVIDRRIARIALGNFGDSKAVGEGVSELRIDFGPGYRVYFTKRGNVLIILLCGGDKSSQHRDIKAAQEMAKQL